MICAIYKSSKKEGAYLYVPKKDDFSQVPDALMQMFGKPTMVMVVKLEGRTLAQVNVEKVKQSMMDDGFFLQLPPPPKNLLDEYKEQKARQESV
ncbi:YcgL domain-containing protein [Vibrio renipiscarius]|uniref:YcgL domain-containing protein OJ16_04630 n=1 Tax=Vibrio renipiscarius TaxID=1461322 RepID=A0A0C2JRE3_9VIBR|nr:YcgL domain-containing protein [Vibrio renipiscarius]KII79779.1 YcgL domain-containing protein [Vibrio renipiscarius]KII80594.1 YcgL domain-containing protein [Vibrio renipiscarius]